MVSMLSEGTVVAREKVTGKTHACATIVGSMVTFSANAH